MEHAAFASILVPVDGSLAANGALRLALRLATPDGELVFVHVIDPVTLASACGGPYGGDMTPAIDAMEDEERDIFAKAGALAREAGIRSTTVSLDGPPASCIASLAARRKVAAIVMGTHGRRGLARLVLGSTAAGVLHAVGTPTFVVHEQSVAAPGPFGRIVVALDATAASAGAVSAAVDLAAREDGSVFFAHVVEPDDDPGTVERVEHDARAYALAAGVAADGATLHGDIVDALLISADTCHAGLTVIGAHGRGRLPLGIGSVAEAVARTSRVPVLVVPPRAAATLNPSGAPPLHAAHHA